MVNVVNEEWDTNYKGIDDALQAGIPITQTPVPAPDTGGVPEGFVNNDDGLFYGDPDGENLIRIGQRLDVTARVRDAHQAGWGKLVRFRDPEGVEHTIKISAETLQSDESELCRQLASPGYEFSCSRRHKKKIAEYIERANPRRLARIVSHTGWQERDSFVLGSEVFGAGDEEYYLEVPDSGSPFQEAGTLEDWQRTVAEPCRGNSRLQLAIAIALAPPLLRLLNLESGGCNLKGPSSIGKTTALAVAGSVWGGEPHRYIQRWRTTTNGLEAIAMKHCDSLLVLDELGQIDPREAGEAAYMLANGAGKVRATRTGQGRAPAHWRLLFLSSGEIGLADHVATSGKRARGRQIVRMADIPAEAGTGLGIFEDLHGYATPAEFAKALYTACNKHYGTAIRAYLTRLTAESPQDLMDNYKAVVRAFSRCRQTRRARPGV